MKNLKQNLTAVVVLGVLVFSLGILVFRQTRDAKSKDIYQRRARYVAAHKADAEERKQLERHKQDSNFYMVDQTKAWYVARSFVEDRLRAPGTAKWPCCAKDFTTYLGNRRYEIVSYVDAQNGFGALIRTRFRCIVDNDFGDQWGLESLTFYE